MTDAAVTRRYTTVAIALHWAIATLIIGLIPIGILMARANEAAAAGQATMPAEQLFSIYQLHKTFGLLVLVLSVARVVWRLANPPPPEPASLAWWERVASSTVHFLLYLLIVAIPLAGWVMVSASPQEIATYLFQIEALPWPHLPALSELPIDRKDELEPLLQRTHRYLAYGAGFLIALHIGAALKHQIIDKDKVLARMAPGAAGEIAPPEGRSRGLAVTVGLSAVLLIGGLAWGRIADGVSGDRLAGARAELADASPRLGDDSTAGWVVDHEASSLTFEVQWQDRPQAGSFAQWSADIRFDPNDLDASRAIVRVDAATGSTGIPYLDTQMTGADGFRTAEHPQIVFETTAFRDLGDGRYEADADLTMRGQTHAVTLPFELTIEGERARMTGELTLDRLEFGLGARNDSSGGYLGLQVRVRAEVEATLGGDGARS